MTLDTRLYEAGSRLLDGRLLPANYHFILHGSLGFDIAVLATFC
jgi:hypothetical protein